MSSFFCERTAEYAVVPLLQRFLALEFGSAIPIFYWKSREGNSASRQLHKAQDVRVLAMFARRPKLHSEELIAGKINDELFEFSNRASELGIPTIAGFPAVSNILDLYADPSVFWFLVAPLSDGEGIFFIDAHKSAQHDSEIQCSSNLQRLALDDIAEIVRRDTRKMAWEDAMECLSMLRSKRMHYSWPPWSGYKPVYFLIPRNG